MSVCKSTILLRISILLIVIFYSCCRSILSEEKSGAAGQVWMFEEIGAVEAVDLEVWPQLISRNGGRYYVWGKVVKKPGRQSIVGISADTGEVVEVDLLDYGLFNIPLAVGPNENIYTYAGERNGGHFLRYNVESGELEDLGVPTVRAIYWMSGCQSNDEKFYVGTYPDTRLVMCDMRTGEVYDLGRISDDERQKYFMNPAIGDDNVVYCPVGKHHQELWSYDVESGSKEQILPAELMSGHGNGRVWTGVDGEVYGRIDGTEFLCRPDGIEIVEDVKVERKGSRLIAGKKEIKEVDEQGRLVVMDRETGRVRKIDTELEPWHMEIFAVGCEAGGKIYGGTINGACLFSYDISIGKVKNYGRITNGSTQIYDVLNHERGLFLASYLNCIDLYDPGRPVGDDNPVPVADLGKEYEQERPVDLICGPDGMIYVGTIPSKGVVGGALVRINPEDLSYEVWRNVIFEQSVIFLLSVPETREVFCVTDIRGGSSTKATQKEACVFLWDVDEERLSWNGRPVEGARFYGCVSRTKDGLILGTAKDKFYAFCPERREVVYLGELLMQGVECTWLNKRALGADGLIYGVQRDVLFAINPEDWSVEQVGRHESLVGRYRRGFSWAYMTDEGDLYYGQGGKLMRGRRMR